MKVLYLFFFVCCVVDVSAIQLSVRSQLSRKKHHSHHLLKSTVHKTVERDGYEIVNDDKVVTTATTPANVFRMEGPDSMGYAHVSYRVGKRSKANFPLGAEEQLSRWYKLDKHSQLRHKGWSHWTPVASGFVFKHETATKGLKCLPAIMRDKGRKFEVELECQTSNGVDMLSFLELMSKPQPWASEKNDQLPQFWHDSCDTHVPYCNSTVAAFLEDPDLHVNPQDKTDEVWGSFDFPSFAVNHKGFYGCPSAPNEDYCLEPVHYSFLQYDPPAELIQEEEKEKQTEEDREERRKAKARKAREEEKAKEKQEEEEEDERRRAKARKAREAEKHEQEDEEDKSEHKSKPKKQEDEDGGEEEEQEDSKAKAKEAAKEAKIRKEERLEEAERKDEIEQRKKAQQLLQELSGKQHQSVKEIQKEEKKNREEAESKIKKFKEEKEYYLKKARERKEKEEEKKEKKRDGTSDAEFLAEKKATATLKRHQKHKAHHKRYKKSDAELEADEDDIAFGRKHDPFAKKGDIDEDIGSGWSDHKVKHHGSYDDKIEDVEEGAKAAEAKILGLDKKTAKVLKQAQHARSGVTKEEGFEEGEKEDKHLRAWKHEDSDDNEGTEIEGSGDDDVLPGGGER